MHHKEWLKIDNSSNAAPDRTSSTVDSYPQFLFLNALVPLNDGVFACDARDNMGVDHCTDDVREDVGMEHRNGERNDQVCSFDNFISTNSTFSDVEFICLRRSVRTKEMKE